VQADAIRAQLSDVTLLGTLKYSRSLQQADIKRAPVFGADAEVTEELRQAKSRLANLL
jgi:hypothetical protein